MRLQAAHGAAASGARRGCKRRTVACVRCAERVGFNDWHWIGEWPFAVGFLGLTFWNWPLLSPAFIAEVAARLGHRVVVTKGKL